MAYGLTAEESDAALERLRGNVYELVDQIALAHPDLTEGEIQWYGSGDEGGVQESHWTILDGEIITEVELDDELDSQICMMIDEILGHLYGGWFNNEGGVGAAKIDFDARTVLIEHNWFNEETSADNPVLLSESGVEVKTFEPWSKEEFCARIEGANEYVLERIQAILQNSEEAP